VYRRSGGHSYEATVPGPIGSILAPARDTEKFYTLPHACSLCGSCTDVCPVKIDLHHQLFAWRQKIAEQGLLPFVKTSSMQATSFLFRHPKLYRFLGSVGRRIAACLPRFLLYNKLNPWGKQRELPIIPLESFSKQYKKHRKDHDQ